MSQDTSSSDLYTRQPLPTSLKVVAWVFLIFGILSAIEIISSLVAGKLSLNFGVLGIFIGRGLLRLSPGWRTVALICLWFMFGLLVILMLATIGGCEVKVTWVGERLPDST